MTTRAPGMTLGQFMNQPTGGGGRNKYVGSKWKERGFLHAWLHPSASILSLWRHGFARIHVNEDRQTGAVTREVYGDQLVCYEDPAVCESYRDKVTYKLEVPPTVCPLHLLQEHLVELVVQKKLDWRTPLFRFEGTDSRKTRIMHVGGFTGMFQWKPERLPPHCVLSDLSGAESGDPVKKAAQLSGQDPYFPAARWLGPVYQQGDNAAFQQNGEARQEFAFTVVDNDDVQAGAQVFFGAKSLGDRVHEAIAKAVKESICPQDPSGSRGDIQRNPYVIRMEYNPTEGKRDPKKYYDAMPMRQIPMTPQVYAILSAPPPDVSKLAERFNLQKIRARLEEHSLLKSVPWDAYFKKALALEAAEKAEAERAEMTGAVQVPAQVAPQAPAFGPAAGAQVNSFDYSSAYPPVTQAPAAPAFAPAPAAPAAQEVDCDRCSKPMLASDTTCPHCGMVYVVEAAPPPPPPPRPKRSAVGGATQAAPAHGFPAPGAPPPGFDFPAPAQPAFPAPQQPGGGFGPPPPAPAVPDPFGGAGGAPGGGYPGDPGDDVPFLRNATLDASEAWV